MLIRQTWECDGTNLVVLFEQGPTLPPAVIRADLIPYLGDAEASGLPGRPFEGGDHIHVNLSLPIRAPREEVPS